MTKHFNAITWVLFFAAGPTSFADSTLKLGESPTASAPASASCQAGPEVSSKAITAMMVPLAVQSTAAPGADGRIIHLSDAIQAALKAQPLIQQARAQTAAGAGLVEQGRAGLLPQISGSALYEMTTSGANPAASATGQSAVSSTSTAAHGIGLFSVSGTQMIYDFNQTRDKMRSAQRTVDSLKASEHTAQLQVLMNTRQAFFTARANKDLISVAKQTLASEERHVAQVRGFVAAGTQPEIALVSEQTNLANDQYALIAAQNNYELAKAQLNQAMGVSGDTQYDVAEEGIPAVPGEDGPDDQLLDQAMKSRPELVAYQKAREANLLTVSSLKGGFAPTISALGSVGAVDPGVGSADSNWSSYWTVGAQVTWPIFQGGTTVGQVHTAQANVDFVDAQLEAEKLQIQLQVRQAVLTVRAAKASIDAANQALSNSREQLKLAEAVYSSGVGDILQLTTAQIAASNAAVQVVQTSFNLSNARAQLLSAIGKP